MKELVMDILEAYEEERLPMSVIANMLGVSIEMVEQVISDYSEDKIGT
jgi:NADH:ubiquinone oxidoreductase subunit E